VSAPRVDNFRKTPNLAAHRPIGGLRSARLPLSRTAFHGRMNAVHVEDAMRSKSYESPRVRSIQVGVLLSRLGPAQANLYMGIDDEGKDDEGWG
jgi:hypothetical protein